METLQSLTNKLAENIAALEPEGSPLTWDIRGEVGTPMTYDRSLIAILSFGQSEEQLYGNRTQRLTGSIVGQVLVDQLGTDDITIVLEQLQTAVYDYVGSMRYTEVGDAVVIQGTCDSILTEAKSEYWQWVLPIELIVQF